MHLGYNQISPIFTNPFLDFTYYTAWFHTPLSITAASDMHTCVHTPLKSDKKPYPGISKHSQARGQAATERTKGPKHDIKDTEDERRVFHHSSTPDHIAVLLPVQEKNSKRAKSPWCSAIQT